MKRKSNTFCGFVYILLSVCFFSVSVGCGIVTQGGSEAVEDSSNPAAWAREGNALVVEGKYEEAIPLLEKAAEAGEPIGLQTLGWCYFFGYGVEQNYDEAFRLYMLAADQGYVLAEYAVAYSYYTGLGAEQNYDEAVRYFNLAADQDLVEAWVALGECYYKGNGVEKDMKKSAEMYQKALDAGFEPGEEDQAIIDEVLG